MPAESVHAIVTDPPYDLLQASRNGSRRLNNPDTPAGRSARGFMRKLWDGTGIAFDPSFWAEAYRVLKPGGHLLAFGGTRTYHRMVVAIEDAGFEIRDCLVWAYASGFPKSLDVSKAIDKAADYRLKAEVRRAAVTAVETAGLTLPGNSRWDWTRGEHAPSDQWWAEFLRWIPTLTDEERDRVERATVETVRKTAGWFTRGDIYEITAPATDDAKRWDGWGTALKPAWEPIVMARKPLVGSVAVNVLAHGTGALNIDGCRIGTERPLLATTTEGAPRDFLRAEGRTVIGTQDGGRWPANLLLTDAEMFDVANPGVVGSGEVVSSGKSDGFVGPHGALVYGTFARNEIKPENVYGDSGTYARFFLIPKPARSEREPKVRGQLVERRVSSHPDGRQWDIPGSHSTDRENVHPTVKPIELMRHLVRLVTPPGGVVLDPFLGSGTTALAAEQEGFRWIGIEREAEYVEIAKARLNGTQRGLGL